MPHTSGRKKVRDPASRRRRNRRVVAIVVIVAILGTGFYIYLSKQPSPAPATTTLSTIASGAPGLTYARINTSLGAIEVELFQSATPNTVANFVNLAKSGFYNNLVWHRIVKGFVIQTGDPNTRDGGGDRSLWGTGGSSQTVPLEINSTLHNYLGYLGMARSPQDLNSGSSQFYINLANNTSLDGKYTVFGKVISGMDVAVAIGNVPVNSSDQPVNLVFVTGVSVINTP